MAFQLLLEETLAKVKTKFKTHSILIKEIEPFE